ncbi:hypothetical protein SEUCBS139899_003676 [Sporothrix eucalyptigena]
MTPRTGVLKGARWHKTWLLAFGQKCWCRAPGQQCRRCRRHKMVKEKLAAVAMGATIALAAIAFKDEAEKAYKKNPTGLLVGSILSILALI